MSFDVIVNKNGSFSITNGVLNICSCYPGIDCNSIKPLEVKITRKEKCYIITYVLEEGLINTFVEKSNSEIQIRTELIDFVKMPTCYNIISQAEINGVEGVYRQGFGMTGPSGYEDIETYDEKREKIKSYGLIALKNNKNYVIMSVANHDRFINQYDIQFIQSDMFNMFVNEKQTKRLFTASFRLEGMSAENIQLPVLNICETNNLEGGLKEIAKKIGNVMKARNHKEPAYHWCSWYYLYYNFSFEYLKQYLENFSKIKNEIPFKYIQIDAGYFTSCGDWLDTNERFPHGLKIAFEEIKKYNYKPAIWIGPFMVGNRSQLYKNHPDWILYGLDEKPLTPWKFYGEEHVWGLKDEEYYILDTSHPDAMEYMRIVFRTLKNWGAELFKTDFMFWGIQDSTQVKRYTPGRTSVEYFREFLSVIRQEIGEESYWLGCIAPFLPFIGFADGMRIAGDVGAQWNNSVFGPENMIREVVADNYFNNIYWQNDPDAMLIRDFHTHLTEEETESLVLLQAMSGGAVYTSDPIHEISLERLQLFQFVKPEYKVSPTIPYLGCGNKEVIIVNKIKGENRYAILIFNPTEYEITRHFIIKDITGLVNVYIRDWKTGFYSDGLEPSIQTDIPAHGCKLYFVSSLEVLDWEIENIWNWDIDR